MRIEVSNDEILETSKDMEVKKALAPHGVPKVALKTAILAFFGTAALTWKRGSTSSRALNLLHTLGKLL